MRVLPGRFSDFPLCEAKIKGREMVARQVICQARGGYMKCSLVCSHRFIPFL